MTAEMKVGHWHSPEGDLIIFIPDKRFVMAIDALSSGAVPFMGLDLTMNMRDYLTAFDQLLALDFDVMVPGHHSIPASRADVQVTKAYVVDVYKTLKRIHECDHKSLFSQAVAKYGKENSFAVARVLSDHEAGECAKEIQERWATKLETSTFGLKATAGPPWSMQSGMSARARRANSLPSDLTAEPYGRSRTVSRLALLADA